MPATAMCVRRSPIEHAMTVASSTQRLRSLDVFRGFTIASMVLVNNPGDWAHIYAPLRHAAWNGWTFTDWIFPFFLFIVGVSLTLSTVRSVTAGVAKTSILLQLWRRALVIIFIGLALNFIPSFSFETLRYPGVLQRIGLCIVIAAPIVLWCRVRGQFLWAVALMAVYAAIELSVPIPDAKGVIGTGLLEPGRDVGAFIDRMVMSGHLWAQAKTWDPEGLLSTLPAVSSLLFGALLGCFLHTAGTPANKTAWVMIAGLLALWVGVILDAVLMPINKSLWTPSYTVFMTGWALLLFAACYWLVDACDSARIRARSTWLAKPLEMYGVNALFIFAFSGLVAKMLGYFKVQSDVGAAVSVKAWMFATLSQLPLSPINVSLLFAVLFNALMLMVAWLLWRNKIFIKV
jgi:predicted acyltransferase